jgi:sugar/nucleoside kinase (ribokinase family)
VDALRHDRRLGGGGANTAVPLAHAGHDVVLVAPLGTDERGERLLGKLREAGVDTSAVVRVDGESTRSLVLVDPEGERTIVNVHRCRAEGLSARLARLEADALYVRSREADLADAMREAAGRATVVAHVPPLTRGSRPAHVLVGSASDLPPAFVGDPWDVSEGIAGSLLRWVVLTMGAHGAEAVSAEDRIATPAPSVKAVDSTAAGDVFAAGLVHALRRPCHAPGPGPRRGLGGRRRDLPGPARPRDHPGPALAPGPDGVWGQVCHFAIFTPKKRKIADLTPPLV